MPDIKIPHGLPVRPHIEQKDQDAKIRDASKMYEKHFLNEMVKAMRQTVSHSTEPSMAENIYAEQLDQQYVDHWSERGGVGFADIIYNQVQERFFHNGAQAPRPHSPIPIDGKTKIKFDETKSMGIPVVSPKAGQKNEVSFLYEWENLKNPETREVVSPYAGEVLQSFHTSDERQIVKLAHDDGLVSTLSYLGRSQNLQPGDRVDAGQKLGTLSPQALGLTWQMSQVES